MGGQRSQQLCVAAADPSAFKREGQQQEQYSCHNKRFYEMGRPSDLTDNPELRFTPAGTPVVNFTVASTPRVFDRNANEWRFQ